MLEQERQEINLTSRRAFMAGAAALAPGAALVRSSAPVDGLGAVQRTPILSMFRDWTALHRQITADLADIGDEPFDRLTRIEKAICEESVLGLFDLAAKLIVSTNNGDFGVPDAIMAEARQIVGGFA